jgi:adenylate kinase
MLIFISGIHGVGKGSLCQRLESDTGFKHFSASDLIKWEKISALDNKLVQDIPSTQDLLIDALNREKKKHANIILDGHFVLLNKDSEPIPIDKEVFSKISPGAIVCLTQNPAVIHERLMKRDGKAFTLSLLSQMQSMEEQHSLEYANNLQIPYLTADGETKYQEIISIISSHEDPT